MENIIYSTATGTCTYLQHVTSSRPSFVFFPFLTGSLRNNGTKINPRTNALCLVERILHRPVGGCTRICHFFEKHRIITQPLFYKFRHYTTYRVSQVLELRKTRTSCQNCCFVVTSSLLLLHHYGWPQCLPTQRNGTRNMSTLTAL